MAAVSEDGWFVGIDLGDRKSNHCFLDARGQIVAEGTVATTQEELEALFRRMLEYYDLVAKGQDLCLEGKARSKAEKEGRSQRREHGSHGLRSYQAGLVSAMFSAWTELLAGTGGLP